jgi:hypothetical protein
MRNRPHERADGFPSIAAPSGLRYALYPARPGKSSNDTYRQQMSSLLQANARQKA